VAQEGFCGSCGNRLSPGARFCASCGQPAAAGVRPAANLQLAKGLGIVFGAGPSLATLAVAVLVFVPSHDLRSAAGQGVITLASLGALRVADRLLAGVWRLLSWIPGPLRLLGAVALPILIGVSQLGPQASSHEVLAAQQALYLATLVAYLLLRPGRGGFGRAAA